MCASFELQIKDILQHINKLTPNMRFNVSTERVKNMLPLKSIDEIKTIEVLLQEESLLKEYRTFILKIGGHSPRETIRNVLSRIFSNECSIKCSWKRRRQNFGVAKLTHWYYERNNLRATYINRKRNR